MSVEGSLKSPAGADPGLDTRARLIEAAGEVFAEVGFKQATVRDICAKAGANIAAVNYHFRDKETLYAETIAHAHRYSVEHYPMDGGLPPTAKVEQRLEAFVRTFLAKILDPNRPSWHGLVMSREMQEPTLSLDTIVETGVRPNFHYLCDLVRELGPHLNPVEVEGSAASVIGQILHYFHCRRIIARLYRGRTDGFPYDLDLLTGHITAFSLAAIRGLEQQSRHRAENTR
ncbi:MAG: CerR family C-terminal domain-containing protein [Phycisphaerales bacterium]|nr:CerR family C-terminal domain-containing protein [Phycisphaerales bacterium]